MKEKGRISPDIYEMRLKAETGNLGLRDRHKVDKLKRISAATRELFSEHGYEGTTLRAIARRADVALGTVALYAKDKRELIVLFNLLVPPLIEEARAAIDPKASLVDNMVSYFTPYYKAFEKDKRLYRIVLGQIFNTSKSIHAKQNGKIRLRLMESLLTIVEHAKASGEIDPDGDMELLTKTFFYIHFGAVRLWLAEDEPVVKDGIAVLRGMFDQHVNGIKRR